MSQRLETLHGDLFRPLTAGAAAAVLGGAATAPRFTVVAWAVINGELLPAYEVDPDPAPES